MPARQQVRAGKSPRNAVTRSLAIILEIARSTPPVRLTDISKATGIPKGTVHRLMRGLEHSDFVVRDSRRNGYGLGPRATSLGLALISHVARPTDRREILARLVDKIGETCNLTTLAGHEVIYIERVETRWPLRLHLEPGSRVPVHCTASGKLLLAFATPRRRDAILAATDLIANTERTIVTRTELDRELDRIRRRGASIDNEEFISGLVAVAVPVRVKGGRVIAAVACHAPIGRFDLKAAIRTTPLLTEAAREMAATFAG